VSHRATYGFKKSYETGSNIVKVENGDVLADSHNILNRWKNCISAIECRDDR
jgi:hypothetical protein